MYINNMEHHFVFLLYVYMHHHAVAAVLVTRVVERVRRWVHQFTNNNVSVFHSKHLCFPTKQEWHLQASMKTKETRVFTPFSRRIDTQHLLDVSFWNFVR